MELAVRKVREIPARDGESISGCIDAMQLSCPRSDVPRPAARTAAEVEPGRVRRQPVPRENREVSVEELAAIVARERTLIEMRPLPTEAADHFLVDVACSHAFTFCRTKRIS